MRQLAFRIACGLMLLVAVAGAVASPGAAAAGISWQHCATPELPTRECGELVVPLDYDEPEGATITLAVARVPASDQAARIGSLITNPGGPGGSGVDGLTAACTARCPRRCPRNSTSSASTPAASARARPCAASPASPSGQPSSLRIPSVPIGDAEVAARQRAAAELARRCGERNAEILPHLSTANVARDMDRLRQAVGDDMLTYLGSSYGTYLGATYANLFPGRIRAMVLDGVINPPSYTSFDHGDGDVLGPDTDVVPAHPQQPGVGQRV